MSDEYLDPAAVARYEDIAAQHHAVLAQLVEEHEREVAELHRASAERDQRTSEFLDKLAAAVERRDQAKEAEQQNRWPDREKKNRVLSFREEQEQPVPAVAPAPPQPPPPPSPPPEPAPAPMPAPAPAPQPSTPERPRKGKVLNFSTDDEEDDGFQGFRRRR